MADAMGSAQVAPRSLFAIRAGPRHCPLRRAAPVKGLSLKKSSSCTTGPYRSLFQVEVECGLTSPEPSQENRFGKDFFSVGELPNSLIF
jgi:hypothetical protein